MRITLFGNDSTANLGDQAILIAMMKALGDVFKGACFTILSAHPDLARERLGDRPEVERIGAIPWMARSGATICRILAGFTWSRMLARAGLLWTAASRERVEAARWIRQSDLVVLVGGRWIASPYFGTVMMALWALREAQGARVPVVAYSQSVGPFRTMKEKGAAHALLAGLKLIVARDTASMEFLRHFSAPGPRVAYAPDCVFALTVAPAGAVDEAMRVEEIDESRRPLVAVTARTLAATMESYRQEEHERYLDMMARICDALIEDGVQLVFLSSTYAAGDYDRSDPDIGKTFRNRMNNPGALKIVEREYPVQVLKGMYGRMDLVVSTRMHPTILASAMKVPVIALAYEYKGVEVLNALGLGEYAVSLKDATADDVIALARKALAEKETIAGHLEERIPEIQRQALEAARFVKEAYEDAGR